MGLFTNMKAAKAYSKHGKGELAEARKLYEEAIAEGCNQPRYILAYSTLLIRAGEYAKARDLLVKFQKAPGMTPDQKVNLFMNYAACCYRMGDIDKGIAILERQHAHQPTSMVYQTLGYLYVDKYALTNKPDFDALEAEAAAVAEAQAETAGEDAEFVEAEVSLSNPPVLSPREAWNAAVTKTKALLDEALEYDDEDAVCLDNMGQYFYRVLGDKEAAREWFLKAHAIKPHQIDTLWFLSRYDVEEGNVSAAREKLTDMLDGRFSALNYVSKEQVEAELERLK